MHKNIIIMVLFFILFCCGCELSNLNNQKKPTKLITTDIRQLIGVTYSDMEKIYGSPDKSTYYLNDYDLSKLRGNYITLRDFNHHSIIRACYNISENDDSIILWYKNNVVIKACFDEMDIINEDDLYEEINNKNTKIDYFKSSSTLKDKPDLGKYGNYIGSNIKSFNKNYNLICPKIRVNLLNNNNTILYFYDINKSNNDCLFIISNNNKIIYINTINFSKICETILKYIK